MTYPSISDSVAQDQIKAFVDRILRMKGEVKALNADIREIYGEAKAVGFDKTVLGKLVGYVEKREADSSAVMESEAIFDLYLTAYDSAAGKVGTKRATHTHASEAAGIAPETVKLLNTVADGMQTQAGRDALVTALDVMIEAEENTEPHPTKADGSDLATSPANDDGQVADIPDIANPISNKSTDASQEHAQTATGSDTSGDNLGSASRPMATAKTDVPADQGQASGDGQSQDNSGVRVASVETMYADPGVITWESCPPEPVERHEYSAAFGDLGQDIEVITEDMREARSAPIVKVKNKILDGWARYMKARELGIEYPVMQYDGTDWLVDCIKWNIEGRILTDQQKRTISNRLIAIFPQRKGIIWAAMAGEDIGV